MTARTITTPEWKTNVQAGLGLVSLIVFVGIMCGIWLEVVQPTVIVKGVLTLLLTGGVWHLYHAAELDRYDKDADKGASLFKRGGYTFAALFTAVFFVDGITTIVVSAGPSQEIDENDYRQLAKLRLERPYVADLLKDATADGRVTNAEYEAFQARLRQAERDYALGLLDKH